MPNGIIIMQWDPRSGGDIVARYPESSEIDPKILMQLYSQHEYTGKIGFVVVNSLGNNVASYYLGPELGIYIILILGMDEEAEIFETGLVDIADQIVSQSEPAAIQPLLPSILQRLIVYPNMNEEQKLGRVLTCPVQNMILNRLRIDLIVPQSDIENWVRDEYKGKFIDIESEIFNLAKQGFVKIAGVEDLESNILFMVEDIMALRKPPTALYRNPTEYHCPRSQAAKYTQAVVDYFKTYQPTEEDNRKIIQEVLLDQQVYETFKLLRQAIVTRNDIEKLKKKGVDDVDRVLETLTKCQMIFTMSDEKKTEYFGLISDFFVTVFYPTYKLDVITDMYRRKDQSDTMLLKALELLREEFIQRKTAEKKKEEPQQKKTKKKSAKKKKEDPNQLYNIIGAYAKQ